MTIYIDMDGTIVDSFKRFYYCYIRTMNKIGLSVKMSLEEFILLRKSGERMFKLQSEEWDEFAKTFDGLLEKRESLKFDTIIPGMYEFIEELYNLNYTLCVVSFRSNRLNLMRQLDDLGLLRYVSVVCMPFDIKNRVGIKADIIKHYDCDPKGCIIGDDVYEISAGKELGLKTISVTWGSREREVLEGFKPDYIVDRPEQLLEVI